MMSVVQELLTEFDQLTEYEQRELTREIILRTRQWGYADLSEDDIAAVADEAFARLDEEEAGHAHTGTR